MVVDDGEDTWTDVSLLVDYRFLTLTPLPPCP